MDKDLIDTATGKAPCDLNLTDCTVMDLTYWADASSRTPRSPSATGR